MALDLTGIENIEFYSGHYLDAVLEGDLKSVFKTWREAKEEQGRKTPQEHLAALANPYFQSRAQADGERDVAERWRIARDFHVRLLEALGFEYKSTVEPLEDRTVCPVLLSLKRDGNPFLWVADAPFPLDEDDDPLAQPPLPEQLPQGSIKDSLAEGTWRELLDGHIFRQENPPRWVIFLAGAEILLIERSKWPQGRYLRFDLGEIFRRKQASALKAMAGLLHRDVLAPDTGVPVHDILDESSHKHAYAVSGDLKHGVRRAVELLANEAVHYRRTIQKQAVFSEEELAEKLTAESLTWLYRLLFLFFVEARGADLEVVPMASDAYRDGYSLEALRDLELVPLTTEHARNGFFLHDSLQKLFRILNKGFPGHDQTALELEPHHDTMIVPPLNSPLFDDERLEVLQNVRFRNFVLQEVLQLLSLSAEKKGKTRGRISYAQLGINQLGAVYEGLLSYTGFFATEDLYEVASAKDNKTLSGKPAAEREALKTYFVPASRIADYKDSEIVRDEDGKKVVHPKGTFIFRLAGRNREKSASYYTPEVLTRCLVKYALEELLWEEDEETGERRRTKTADEILELTICEPAMGSSAFLIEAVDQLADVYLEARQEELHETIPPEDYQKEKRRAKARLATNNCYGVDLNPTAVELAKVSLWLATIYDGGKCPWFGLRLATGNSLIGARREVFRTADVTRNGSKKNPNWLGLVPEPVPLSDGGGGRIDASWTAPRRPQETIYHFLLPADGMAPFDRDPVVRDLVPDAVKAPKSWRKEFTKKLSKDEARRLERLSDAVDALFEEVVRERALAAYETTDRIPVWGESGVSRGSDLHVRDQEDIAAALENESSAYRRLELVMDAWCALWFWPLDQVSLLPDRETWIGWLELVLLGDVDLPHRQEVLPGLATWPQLSMDLEEPVEGIYEAPAEEAGGRLERLRAIAENLREERKRYLRRHGLADVAKIVESTPGLQVVEEVAERIRFHHWELRFAEVFAQHGGFDLILGNPPWIKLQWSEGPILSDHEPTLGIRSLTATEIGQRRQELLTDTALRDDFLLEYEEMEGTQTFLNHIQSYPLLQGIQTNSYKCFVTHSWRNATASGCAAFLHPEGVYDDPKGAHLREQLYPRLRYHFQLVNELRLFPEIGHLVKFSLNIYSPRPREDVQFFHISNLFHPATIDQSFNHDGAGPIPALKTREGDWQLRAHRNRIIAVDSNALRIFSELYDGPGAATLRARLPVIHSREILAVLEQFSKQPRRLSAFSDQYFGTEMWHETNSQKDGTIRRQTNYPDDLTELIISGPHFFVGTPLRKNPNTNCSSHLDYRAIDLETVSSNFIPRTNYVPACSPTEYAQRVIKWKNRRIDSYYRHVNRRMFGTTGERSLICCVVPPGPGHINTVVSAAFEDLDLLMYWSGLACSLPYDLLLRVTGRSDLYPSDLGDFPIPDAGPIAPMLAERATRLNALTSDYAELAAALTPGPNIVSGLISPDRRVRQDLPELGKWSRSLAFRTDLERRQAFIEIDVLASMALGIDVEDLLTIQNVQFAVLSQVDRERLYDQLGRIVPTSHTSAGNPAVNLVKLAAVLKEQAGFEVNGEYYAADSSTEELRKQRIRLGKREAGVLGVSERCTMADLVAETEVRWCDEEHPGGRPVRLVGLRYTDPGLEPRMERVYPTPWTRSDREADYRQAWAEFERRLGKRMPEVTALASTDRKEDVA